MKLQTELNWSLWLSEEVNIPVSTNSSSLVSPLFSPNISCIKRLYSWTWSWAWVNNLSGLPEQICTRHCSSGLDIWPFSFLLLIHFLMLFNLPNRPQRALSMTEWAETFFQDGLVIILKMCQNVVSNSISTIEQTLDFFFVFMVVRDAD